MRPAAGLVGTESGTYFPLRRGSLSLGLHRRCPILLALAGVTRAGMGIAQPSSQKGEIAASKKL